MSIRIVCKSCQKVYNLDETYQGKTVRCRECQSPMSVPTLSRQGRRDEGSRPPDDRIAKSSKPAVATGPADRDDEKPQRRSAARRAPRESEEPQGNKNLVPILVGAGAGVLLLGGLVIGGIVYAVMGSNKSSETLGGPVAIVADQPRPDPAQGRIAPPPGPGIQPLANRSTEPSKAAQAALPSGSAPREMAADVLKKVKQSTAYLRVTMPDGDVAQGSGFFALEQDLVITNAHVVGMLRSNRPPRRVEVVVRSGEDNEAKLPGMLLGLDRQNDLAVLRVQADPSRLPPPLPLASATELVETQKVYIFGFPFGAQLGKNITVSESSISSLRRGDDGLLKQVQVNGGMNPGNSGGPVTDSRGAVIGVSVAGISGTQINFAVPADYIRALVERSKLSPLDLKAPPGPLARNDAAGPMAQNDPPLTPVSGADLKGDLAALKGTWQSGTVSADEGGGSATVKLSISPSAGGGRIQVEIATKTGGRTTSSKSSYGFTLQQEKGQRLLVTNNLGRRGRGMVFIYRVDGNQLVLTGVLATVRIAYTLKNVSFQQTSKEPEQAVADNPAQANPANRRPAPPAAGGSGNASGAAELKIDGDVYAFVEAAVKDKRLADVDIRGFTLGKQTYRDVSDKGVLIGFQVGFGKFVNNDIVTSLRPIYQLKSGPAKYGKWIGPLPQAGAFTTVKAKPGYVVSGLSVRASLKLDALTINFAKLGKDGLDMGDTYASKQLGGNGGQLSTVGGNGQLFVGVTGHLANDGAPCSLGLVAVTPKE